MKSRGSTGMSSARPGGFDPRAALVGGGGVGGTSILGGMGGLSSVAGGTLSGAGATGSPSGGSAGAPGPCAAGCGPGLKCDGANDRCILIGGPCANTGTLDALDACLG